MLKQMKTTFKTDLEARLAGLAERRLSILRIQCTRGTAQERAFSDVADGPDSLYPLSSLEWMRRFVGTGPDRVAAGCLLCLCSHGARTEEFREVLSGRIGDPMLSQAAIRMAEKQNDPETIAIYLGEGSPAVNAAIMSLRRSGNDSYLTMMMLSDDPMVKSAMDRLFRDKP